MDNGKTTTKPDKTVGIRKYAKQRQEEARNRALRSIRNMVRKGIKITIYGVHKESGCSRSFLTSDPAIKEKINQYREQTPKKTEESKAVTTTALYMEIAKLKRIIQHMEEENSNTWKEKYRKLQAENEELKLQLRSIYTNRKKQSRSS